MTASLARLLRSCSSFSRLGCPAAISFNKTYLEVRHFSVSCPLLLKKIEVIEEGNVTTVEGVYLKDNKETLVVPEDPEGLCPTCPKKIGCKLNYKDILIISQFVQEDGQLLSQSVTGLCNNAYKEMRVLVHKAQRAGLMPEKRPPLKPWEKNTGIMSSYKFYKYNVYFEPLTPITLTHSNRSVARRKKRAFAAQI